MDYEELTAPELPEERTGAEEDGALRRALAAVTAERDEALRLLRDARIDGALGRMLADAYDPALAASLVDRTGFGTDGEEPEDLAERAEALRRERPYLFRPAEGGFAVGTIPGERTGTGGMPSLAEAIAARLGL